MRQCKNARGLWTQIPLLIADMVANIMLEIDSQTDEGNLCYDDYYGEEIFHSQDFEDYVVHFIRAAPRDVKSEVVKRIEEAVGGGNYDIFGNILRRKPEWRSLEELSSLKLKLLQQIRAANYNAQSAELDYKTFAPCFNDAEKEEFLRAVAPHSSALTLELAQFYEQRRREADALAAYDAFIEQCSGASIYRVVGSSEIFKNRLRLAEKLREEPAAYLRSAENILKLCPDASILDAAAIYLGEENVKNLEDFLSQSKREEFFQYLRRRRRFEECWQMIEQSLILPETVYLFATEQKQAEPKKAAQIFVRRIAMHESKTNNDAYSVITQTLKHLHAIDKAQTEIILKGFREKYKRRKNLMTLLDGAFGKQR